MCSGMPAPRAAGAAKGIWEQIKAEEKLPRGVLSAAAVRTLPPGRAVGGCARSSSSGARVEAPGKASTVGFDWNDPRAVLAKLREEIDEIEAELANNVPGAERVADEVGDLLFVVVNLARHLGTDPEQALRGATSEFETRFAAIEAALAKQGRTPSEATLDEMEALGRKQSGPLAQA